MSTLRRFPLRGHKKSLFVCVSHPLTPFPSNPYLFLGVLAHYLVCFSPRRPPELLLIPNKGRDLELALGGEKTKRMQCICFYPGSRWEQILTCNSFSLPSLSVAKNLHFHYSCEGEWEGEPVSPGRPTWMIYIYIFFVLFSRSCPHRFSSPLLSLLFVRGCSAFAHVLLSISPVRKRSPFQQGK